MERMFEEVSSVEEVVGSVLSEGFCLIARSGREWEEAGRYMYLYQYLSVLADYG